MNGVQEQSSAGGATSVTTPSDREIVTERVFDAPRERVYAAFTDPELIPEWWGPRKTTTTVDVMDVRPVAPGASSVPIPTEARTGSGAPTGRSRRPSGSSRRSSGRECRAT